MMIPSLWEEESPRSPAPDILDEERERRARRRRGVRAIFPSSWMNGRLGLALLLVFLVGGVGWFGFQRWGGLPGGDGPGHGAVRLESSPVPERRRDLTAGEYSLASRYGLPLYMGEGHVPVVRVESTGEVREVTPFEVEFGSSAYSVVATPRGRVIEVPGPRGWGMWWRDMSEANALRPLVSYERLSWAQRQEDELSRATRGIVLGLEGISLVNPDLWNPGVGLPLARLLSEVKEPYPPARHGHWSAVPDLWVCDAALERDFHQSITPGCPGEEYMEVLRGSWSAAGIVLERMEGIARLIRWGDGLSSEELHQSIVRSSLAHEVIDMRLGLLDLESSLTRLRRVSAEWDLSIVVHLAKE